MVTTHSLPYYWTFLALVSAATTPVQVPGPPLDVRVQLKGSNSLKVTWKAPSEDLRHGTVQGYSIGYKKSGINNSYVYNKVEASLGTQTSYLTNLKHLTHYTIVVKAYNEAGEGPASNMVFITTQETDVEYWRDLSQQAIRDTLFLTQNQNVAKNVILFLGDGMSIPTIMASRVLKGQKMGLRGEETWLDWERFPHSCLIKTYNANTQVADSASTATAYLCGVKTNYETVGVSPAAVHSECDTAQDAEVFSILHWAQQAGKATGFVTTTRVTHATPAALYAHSVNRDWESDNQLPANASKCKDIARQLVEDMPGRDIKVIMGGGRRHFFPYDTVDREQNASNFRRDGRDLAEIWAEEKRERNATFRYVTNQQEFDSVDVENTDFLLGLFEYSHMRYEVDRADDPEGEPSIAEMTKTAINLLQKEPNGYFLLVEGGRIDHAHHDTLALRALEETISMEQAVKVALSETSRHDTLIVVTADHSQVMTVNGYAERGTPITGVAGLDSNNLPYTTLSYANGPGYVHGMNGSRPNLTDIDTSHKDYRQETMVPLDDETHGGEDVALYAVGPMAHLFHGVQEQTYVAYAMAYAFCVGVNLDHCSYSHFADLAVDGASVHSTTSGLMGGLLVVLLGTRYHW